VSRVQKEPELIRGTKALAAFVFGDADKWRQIYPLAAELGLFRWRGFLCGRPATIRSAIAARERRGRKTNDEANRSTAAA
jgi:hypothetical protein